MSRLDKIDKIDQQAQKEAFLYGDRLAEAFLTRRWSEEALYRVIGIPEPNGRPSVPGIEIPDLKQVENARDLWAWHLRAKAWKRLVAYYPGLPEVPPDWVVEFWLQKGAASPRWKHCRNFLSRRKQSQK